MTVNINGTSGISGVDGSAGTPALQGTDSNTGISFGTDEVNINTGGTARATVDSSGRLLVGTTTSRGNFFNTTGLAPRVQIEGTDGLGGIYSAIGNFNGSGGEAQIFLSKSRGTTIGSNTIVQNNDGIGAIQFQGSDGSEFVQAAEIKAWVDGTPGANDMPGRLTFSTTADGASSPTERMRITNDGYILFGTTTKTTVGSHTGYTSVCSYGFAGITLNQYGVQAGFYYDRLNFTNSQYFVVNASGTGVYLGNGSTGWTAYSDERLKENIVDLDGAAAWNHCKNARAVKFNWKPENYPDDQRIGFIAQDWETDYPQVITTTDETVGDVEAPKGMQYTETIPVLMAALKEAIAKIETLEAANASLEARLTALEGGAAQ